MSKLPFAPGWTSPHLQKFRRSSATNSLAIMRLRIRNERPQRALQLGASGPQKILLRPVAPCCARRQEFASLQQFRLAMARLAAVTPGGRSRWADHPARPRRILLHRDAPRCIRGHSQVRRALTRRATPIPRCARKRAQARKGDPPSAQKCPKNKQRNISNRADCRNSFCAIAVASAHGRDAQSGFVASRSWGNYRGNGKS
jgi:hypothetical protein